MIIEDILSKLTLRTAVPFGYLFGSAFLLLLLIGGIVLIALGSRRKKRWLISLGVFPILFVLVTVLASIYTETTINMNPTVRSDQVVGIWVDGSNQIEFRNDGTFRFSSKNHVDGVWTLDDWNLKLSSQALDSESWRVIQVANHFRILRNLPEDCDLWNGDLQFKRQL